MDENAYMQDTSEEDELDRPPTMTELRTTKPIDKSVAKAEAMLQTKEERRMLNYERFQDIWDQHENRMDSHFKKKKRNVDEGGEKKKEAKQTHLDINKAI